MRSLPEGLWTTAFSSGQLKLFLWSLVWLLHCVLVRGNSISGVHYLMCSLPEGLWTAFSSGQLKLFLIRSLVWWYTPALCSCWEKLMCTMLQHDASISISKKLCPWWWSSVISCTVGQEIPENIIIFPVECNSWYLFYSVIYPGFPTKSL